MRYAVEISYDGAHFAGWQLQPDVVTVQGELERVLTLLDGSPVRVSAAGRTDSGVHARGQVASFNLNSEWDDKNLVKAINANMIDNVSVIRASSVPGDFDARYSALWREYAYFVWNGPSCYPHIMPYVWWRKKGPWDDKIVHDCCSILKGRHDFSAFCRVSEVPDNPFRELLKVSYIKRGSLSIFRIRGTAFLTNMIRIIMGNIDVVARGVHSIEWLEELLEGKSRIHSAATAPACGLFFWRVGYRDF